MNNSTCILIFGLQGSGTSCVAGVLHTMGVHMGNEFAGVDNDNANGHFEDLTFVRLFDAMCSRDYEPAMQQWVEGRLADGQQLWGVKCPALAEVGDNLLEFLDDHFVDVNKKVIYVQRPIDMIIKSCQAKRPTTDARIVALNVKKSFERLKLLIVQQCHNYQFLSIQYDNMIDRPFEAIGRLIDFCYPEGGYDMVRCCEAVRFIDKGLRHWVKGA